MMDFLQEENKAMEKENLNLVKDSVKETWNYKDLHVSYDERSLDEALAIGRQGSLFQQWKDRWAALLSGKAAHMDASFDEEAVKRSPTS